MSVPKWSFGRNWQEADFDPIGAGGGRDLQAILDPRMQMATEDSQKFAADCQKIAQKVARSMSPGWSGGGS